MHPPLEIHQHPACKEYILALKACHRDNPIAKYWGVCNDAAKALNICFRGEKVAKRSQNKERLRAEQERLRARFEAKRRAEAAARGEPEPAPVDPTTLPGYWRPESRGIPTKQPAPAQ